MLDKDKQWQNAKEQNRDEQREQRCNWVSASFAECLICANCLYIFFYLDFTMIF